MKTYKDNMPRIMLRYAYERFPLSIKKNLKGNSFKKNLYGLKIFIHPYGLFSIRDCLKNAIMFLGVRKHYISLI